MCIVLLLFIVYWVMMSDFMCFYCRVRLGWFYSLGGERRCIYRKVDYNVEGVR